MSNFRSGLTLMTASAVALALVGCADENPWDHVSNEKGSIDLSLLTDCDISASKPVFVADEQTTRAQDDPYNLGSYTDIPSAEDFKIKLVKNDGSFSKTWNSLSAFKNDEENEFVTGAYTLTAFYGEKNETAFNNPYFETSSTFTVLANKTHKLDLNVGLTNSMVKINFTDDFRNYMSDFYVGLRTEGMTDEFKYQSGEPRALFLPAANTYLTLHYTVADTHETRTKNLGSFGAIARTLHNLTFDVRTVNGKTGLGVSFDDTLEDEDVFIDLSDGFNDMMAAPVISCTGFSNGDTVNLLEYSASQSPLSMEVVAEAGMKSAILTVGTNATAPAWGREIDLCAATPQQIQLMADAGIVARGFSESNQAASLNLTQYSRKLSNGTYTISLQVTDKNSNVSDPATKVTFDCEPISLSGASGLADYASAAATFSLDYNGFDPGELVFKAPDKNGYDADVVVNSFSESVSTRTFDSKTYTYSLTLPTPTLSKEVTVKVFSKDGRSLGSGKVALRSIPTYNISKVDAYSKYAYLQVSAENSSLLPVITENIRLDNSNLFIYARDKENGILTVTGALGADGSVNELQPGKSYSSDYSIFAGDYSYGKQVSIVTETEQPIVNGEFSSTDAAVNSGTINVGGLYEVKVLFITDDYQNYSSYSYNPPSNWATVNTLTAYTGSNPRNTWFEVPSSWVENGKAVMRNVGYNHGGTVPSKSGGQMNTNYYCANTPSQSDLIHAAGEIFLGSYMFNGSESRVDGTAFSSRPSSVSFDYSYSLKNGLTDSGLAYVEVLDASGNVIGTADPFLIPESGETKTKTINISYNKFSGKAATLKLGFKSSSQSNPPIYIPQGSELSEGVTVITSESNRTVETNGYHALATGSVLTIDNVKANYNLPGTALANARKRKASNKR